MSSFTLGLTPSAVAGLQSHPGCDYEEDVGSQTMTRKAEFAWSLTSAENRLANNRELLAECIQIHHYLEHNDDKTYTFVTRGVLSEDNWTLIEGTCSKPAEIFAELYDLCVENGTQNKLMQLVEERQPFLFRRCKGLVKTCRVDLLNVVETELCKRLEYGSLQDSLASSFGAGILTHLQYQDLERFRSQCPAKDDHRLTNFKMIQQLCDICRDNGDDSICQLGNLIWRTNPLVYSSLHLRALTIQPAEFAGSEEQLQLFRYQLMKSDEERLNNLKYVIGGVFQFEKDFQREELVPQCIGHWTYDYLMKKDHNQQMMYLVEQVCMNGSRPARILLEILHSKLPNAVTSNEETFFSQCIRLMLECSDSQQAVYVSPTSAATIKKRKRTVDQQQRSLFGNTKSQHGTLF
jgi:hypothetical protein